MSRKAFALGVISALCVSVPATVWALDAAGGEAAGKARVTEAYTGTAPTKAVSNGSTTKTKTVSNTSEACVSTEYAWTTVLSTSIKKTKSGPVVVTFAAQVLDSDKNTHAKVLLNGQPMKPVEILSGGVAWLESSTDDEPGSFTWHRDDVKAGKKKVTAQIHSSHSTTCAYTRILTISYT